MADLLLKAANKAKAFGIPLQSKIQDQLKWHIAWGINYRGLPAVLLASKSGYMVRGNGFCKSLDALIVNNMSTQGGYVLDYIDELDNIYEIDPKVVISVMAEKPNNKIYKWSHMNQCPLCGNNMPTIGKCCLIDMEARFETYNHRLKYHSVPFRKINAMNINRAKAKGFSPNERWLSNKFWESGLPLIYIGHLIQDKLIERNYGWCPDWIYGDIAVDYDGNIRTNVSQRRRLAEEKGIKLYIIQENVIHLKQSKSKMNKCLDDIKQLLGITPPLQPRLLI